MDATQRFHDRREAGQLLARQLADYNGRDDVVVLALPRGGGVVTAYNIPPHVIQAVADRERIELQRRLQEYRGNRPLLDLQDRVITLVDDELATGSAVEP